MRLDNALVMLRDLRHGLRVLMQAKGWTTVIVLSLAVGIGANTAVFTAVNAILLSELSVRDPDSLVRLKWAGADDVAEDTSEYGFLAGAQGEHLGATFSYPMFQHLRSANQTMVDLAASRPTGGVTVTIDGRAETAGALLVTGNYHALLGVTAQRGRTLAPEDDNPSAPVVATLSDRYWRSRFGADPAVVGKTIRINKVPVIIIGVTEPAFTGTQRLAAPLHDLTAPLRLDDLISDDEPRLNNAKVWWVQITGRLERDITFQQAESNLGPMFQSQIGTGAPRLLVDSARRGTYDANTQQVDALSILAKVVALVLLLVCANIANLLLARATARQKEMSVRLSIGATRARLIRQLGTESLLLAAIGGFAGMLIARWGQVLLPPPVGTTVPADWQVAAFTAAMTALAGMVFGIAPALRATRLDVGTTLKDNTRSVAGAGTVLSKALLVVQVSISLLLLVGAGLFLRTLDNLQSVDIGFDPRNLVFVRVNAEGGGRSDERKLQFLQDGMDRLRALPGVRDATVSKPTLMGGGGFGNAMYVDGRVYTGHVNARDNISRVVVAPNYFTTMGIPLVSGRGFTERDHQTAPKVAVINEAAARKFFPNENPIGRRFGTSLKNTSAIEIVGVLRDVRYNDLRQPPPPTLYLPHLQSNPEDLVFSVRTAGDPAGVMNAARAALSAVDPTIPVISVQTQMSTLETRYAQEKVLAQASALFGGIALFVAAIGLFGLMSYNVSRRTREIGIRMAMGAERREVLGMVLRESMLLVAAGVVIGLGLSLATSRMIASQLFGLEPTDPTTIFAAILVMLAVSAMAGYLPARRAARVDPMVALRYE